MSPVTDALSSFLSAIICRLSAAAIEPSLPTPMSSTLVVPSAFSPKMYPPLALYIGYQW